MHYTKNVRLFLKKIKARNCDKNIDISLIKTAINYVQRYHKGQKRHSGEPYFYHPLEVASIVADYLPDTNFIVAALLHDVIEDTSSSLIQIEFIFNKNIAEIVCAVSKVTQNYKLSKEEVIYKMQNSSQGKKVLIIKVIDRLHNMRTIGYIKSIEKQKRIADETLKIYVPMARKVKLFEIADELVIIASRVLNDAPRSRATRYLSKKL